ncbi:MAG: hypothetical protein ACRDFY_04940 [Candidatus Limnocylindria bacterium]
MRRASTGWAALLAIVFAGCAGSPAPSGSAGVAPDPACRADLAPRTSPTDFPVAVVWVNGDDLPPVLGPVEWTGGDEPATNEPVLPVHLERFTVLQTRGQSAVSVRMTDGVRMAGWTLDAVPAGAFRAGDLETGRVRWSEGDEETDVACVPVTDGSWLLIGEITFADDAGSGTYYWRLNVAETPTT